MLYSIRQTFTHPFAQDMRHQQFVKRNFSRKPFELSLNHAENYDISQTSTH